MRTITLPPDTERLYLEEIAHHIADAMNPEGESDPDGVLYELDKIQAWAEAEQAAKEGVLRVRHPGTHGPFPAGLKLRDNAVVLLSDAVAYFADRGLSVTTCEQMPEILAPKESVDITMLARPDQLIEAFGRFTGMDAAWFDKWDDYTALKDAIKVKGTSGRGRTTEPLFCPFLVMQGLMKKPRKGSNRKAFLTDEKPWELLKRHFPKVYATHQGLSPLDD